MSKASYWWSLVKPTAPPERPKLSCGYLSAQVNDGAQTISFERASSFKSVTLTDAEAIALARWILDVLG
jgi:hypothetical protein